MKQVSRVEYNRVAFNKQSRSKLQCYAAAAAGQDWRTKDPKDIRVLVVGCTGYIGKFVTKELISRGYNVVAFTREKAGIKGKLGKDDLKKVHTPSLHMWLQCTSPAWVAMGDQQRLIRLQCHVMVTVSSGAVSNS